MLGRIVPNFAKVVKKREEREREGGIYFSARTYSLRTIIYEVIPSIPLDKLENSPIFNETDNLISSKIRVERERERVF